ncbi:hypothetical protein, variant [Sphaeroforma arctica JP610]|uniref:Uncharacterized protein n=1 Tax=Sphaeroforma arctica JP610 TaxID=667725 RepID=A0A0L0FIR5_9EUKA|nr:hypothetical protein, variant [Sphaeroforma arctica JP610]KNC76664.1 hypothetical protein, variant [Sphaeroforma arctica JP610]|eukprot:XP_014150566.1 hypothetical protein, variant [Sphaeroforma arctica JP610]
MFSVTVFALFFLDSELQRDRQRAPRLAISDDDDSMSEAEDVRPTLMSKPRMAQAPQRQRQDHNPPRRAQPTERRRTDDDRHSDRHKDRSLTPEYIDHEPPQHRQPSNAIPRARTQAQAQPQGSGRGNVKQTRGMPGDHDTRHSRDNKQLSMREKREKEREMNRERRRVGAANVGDRGRVFLQQMESQFRSSRNMDRGSFSPRARSPERARGRTVHEEREFQREMARQKKLSEEMKHMATMSGKGANSRVTKPAQKQGAIARLQAANSNKNLPTNLKKQIPAPEVKGLAGRIQRQPLSTRLGPRPEIKRLAQAAAAGKAVLQARTAKPLAQQQPRTAIAPKNVKQKPAPKAPVANTREKTVKPNLSKAELDAEMDKFMATAKLGNTEVVWDL